MGGAGGKAGGGVARHTSGAAQKRHGVAARAAAACSQVAPTWYGTARQPAQKLPAGRRRGERGGLAAGKGGATARAQGPVPEARG